MQSYMDHSNIPYDWPYRPASPAYHKPPWRKMLHPEIGMAHPDKIHAYGAPDADSPSFPSGHTAAAFSLATSLSITYPKWYVIAPSAVWACGVGFARMNQGVHYPSDVVAGAAIGVGCAFVNVYVNRWLNKVLFGRQIK